MPSQCLEWKQRSQHSTVKHRLDCNLKSDEQFGEENKLLPGHMENSLQRWYRIWGVRTYWSEALAKGTIHVTEETVQT